MDQSKIGSRQTNTNKPIVLREHSLYAMPNYHRFVLFGCGDVVHEETN